MKPALLSFPLRQLSLVEENLRRPAAQINALRDAVARKSAEHDHIFDFWMRAKNRNKIWRQQNGPAPPMRHTDLRKCWVQRAHALLEHFQSLGGFASANILSLKPAPKLIPITLWRRFAESRDKTAAEYHSSVLMHASPQVRKIHGIKRPSRLHAKRSNLLFRERSSS